MSAENADLEAGEMICCACCGIAGGDDVTLKNCTACYLVKYCSIKCQREHRPQHKRECKKRAAELKDELLFKQPESSHLGDCPICLLPLPFPKSQDKVMSTMYSCCCKLVCNGCVHANTLRELQERLPPSCPFCRRRAPRSEEEGLLNAMKRVEANDPAALCNMSIYHDLKGDHATALEYWKKAAALGHAESHYQLSNAYEEGRVVGKDMKKFMYHAEQAAIGGHDVARHNLGVEELKKGKVERAAKHWIIAAKIGHDFSVEKLKELYAEGIVTKEDFTAALRGYQAAVHATKSTQRDAAEAARRGIGKSVT